MRRSKRRRKRVIKGVALSLLGITLIGAVFARELLTLGALGVVGLVLPGATVSLREAYVDGSSVVLKDLSVTTAQGRLVVPEVKIGRKVEVIDPIVRVVRKGKPRVRLLTWFELALSVKRGTVVWGGERFPFKAEWSKERGATLSVGEGLPALFCEWKGDKLMQVRLQRAPLRPLVGLIPELKGWKVENGEVEFAGDGSFQGKGTVQNAALVNEAGEGLFVQEIAFSIDEKGMRGEVHEGKVVSAVEASRLNLAFSKEEGGAFEVNGEGLIFETAVKGRTRFSSLSDWEGEVAFEEKGAHVVLSRRESLLKMKFDHFDAQLTNVSQEIFMSHLPNVLAWEMTEGEIQGDLEVRDESVCLTRFLAENLKIENREKKWFGGAGRVEGTVSFVRAGVADALLSFSGMEGDFLTDQGEIWNLSNVNGSLALEEGRVLPSHLAGSFLGLDGKITVKGPTWLADNRFELKGSVDTIASLFSYDLAQIYNESEEMGVKIVGRTDGAKVSADLFLEEKGSQPLHLDAHLPDFEQITFSAERLPRKLYAPLFVSLFPNFEVEGKIRLSGSVDESGVRMQIEARGSHVKWASRLLAFDCTVRLDIEKEALWKCRARVEKGSLSLGELGTLNQITFETAFDERNDRFVLHNVSGCLAKGEKFTIEALHLDPTSERFAYGQVEGAIPRMLEAFVRERSKCLLTLSQENETPLAFKGEEDGKGWRFSSLSAD